MTASVLAADLGVSVRTIYRDIASLADDGAPISGEAGLGYVLGPGHFLPPLMLTDVEADAVMLGLRLVMRRSDTTLAAAAAQAIAKIGAVLPPALEEATAANGLLAGPLPAAGPPHLIQVREAMRAERKLVIRYWDKAGASSERTVWPVAIGFFEAVEVLAAWCELRQDFRHFRLDRIVDAFLGTDRPPRRRRILLAEWWAAQGLAGEA